MVVLQVEEVVSKYANVPVVLFNPDLELKGTIGIRERDRRQGFLDSFKSAYIFLCLVSQPASAPWALAALTPPPSPASCRHQW